MKWNRYGRNIKQELYRYPEMADESSFPTNSSSFVSRRHTLDTIPVIPPIFADPIPIVGEGKIIRNSNNQILPASQKKSGKHEDKPKSAVIPHPLQHLESSSPLKSEESFSHSLSSSTLYGHDCKVSSRGTMMMLPKRFLTVPRFRVLSSYENDEKQSFSVKYNRKHYKLGITIQEHNSLIQIVVMHRARDSSMLLAEASGVQVGDVVVGVNGERFGPWAELTDIMDLLTLSGHFVEMQFERYKKQSSWYRTAQQLNSSEFFGSSGSSASTFNATNIPAKMKLFLDNGVISAEQFPILESTIQYFQYRVIKWSTVFLAERIESWHLDYHEQSARHDEYLSSKFDEAAGGCYLLILLLNFVNVCLFTLHLNFYSDWKIISSSFKRPTSQYSTAFC